VTRLSARCPAKVNLSLRVKGERPDGYHEIETVFQAIDLWDEIEGEQGEGLSLTSDHPDLPTDGTNLVLRAADRLRRAAGVAGGARLHLKKLIPIGAGLGGGSSDAAGALLLLRRLWDLDLDGGALARIGGELGADVPFFLTGGTARGTGRGERIEPLPFAGAMPLLLGHPPFGISTADVYRSLASAPIPLTPPGADVSVSGLSIGLPGGNELEFAGNDLEAVVFRRWPELLAFRDALLAAGAKTALLCGSGSSVFGIFDTEEALERGSDGLAARFPGFRLVPSRAIESGARVTEGPGGGR
jgi:4-diphosphocytidyl-2-C-methyl-D-erythritol kinase